MSEPSAKQKLKEIVLGEISSLDELEQQTTTRLEQFQRDYQSMGERIIHLQNSIKDIGKTREDWQKWLDTIEKEEEK